MCGHVNGATCEVCGLFIVGFCGNLNGATIDVFGLFIVVCVDM
jgi:hypothetical protein